MSYDINFWKLTRPLKFDAQQVYEFLSSGEAVDGLATLPVDQIIDRLRKALPGFDPSEKFPLISFDAGSIEPSWSSQDFRFDMRGAVAAETKNTLIEIMAGFGCPMYDPQIGKRYDDNDGLSLGEFPHFLDPPPPSRTTTFADRPTEISARSHRTDEKELACELSESQSSQVADHIYNRIGGLAFNRLVSSYVDTTFLGRLKFWQERILEDAIVDLPSFASDALSKSSLYSFFVAVFRKKRLREYTLSKSEFLSSPLTHYDSPRCEFPREWISDALRDAEFRKDIFDRIAHSLTTDRSLKNAERETRDVREFLDANKRSEFYQYIGNWYEQHGEEWQSYWRTRLPDFVAAFPESSHAFNLESPSGTLATKALSHPTTLDELKDAYIQAFNSCDMDGIETLVYWADSTDEDRATTRYRLANHDGKSKIFKLSLIETPDGFYTPENKWTIESAQLFDIEHGYISVNSSGSISFSWPLGEVDGKFYLGAWSPERKGKERWLRLNRLPTERAATPENRKVVTLTPTAVAKLREFGNFPYVRAGVKSDGSELKYELGFDEHIDPRNDFLHKSQGLNVVVDRESATFLENVSIDWTVNEDGREGFKFHNPNTI